MARKREPVDQRAAIVDRVFNLKVGYNTFVTQESIDKYFLGHIESLQPTFPHEMTRCEHGTGYWFLRTG